jgi:hypothetical protein
MYDLIDSVCGGVDRRIVGDFLGAGMSRVTDSMTNVDGLRNAIAKLCGQDRLRAALRELFE